MENPIPVVLSLGSNLGNRETNIKSALEKISQEIGTIELVSDYYYSDAEGFESIHQFCNVCCLVHCGIAPITLLKKLKKIEKTIGRTSKSKDFKYKDRIIDIDIIFFGNDEHLSIELQIPHPKWQERHFVMVPLVQMFWSKFNQA